VPRRAEYPRGVYCSGWNDEDRYCVDVLTQLNSVGAALRAVGMELLDDHVRNCVTESIERGDGREKVEELMAAVSRFAGR
jgi:DNA-binding FrmR family transcriptional regulator